MNVYIPLLSFGAAWLASVTAVGMADKKKALARSGPSDKRSPKRDSPQAVPILSESEGKCKQAVFLRRPLQGETHAKRGESV